MCPKPSIESLPALLDWLASAPGGTMLAAADVRELLATFATVSPVLPPTPPAEAPPVTWREKLWTVPAETRMGVVEVAEAIGRPRSYVYRCTAATAIPFKKHDGELVFLAGEIRTWLQDTEETVKPGRVARPALSLKRGKAS